MPRAKRPDGLRYYQGLWLRDAIFERDRFIADEALADDYRFRDLDWTPDAIIDIGAHCGYFSHLAHSLWPAARIIAVEPVAECAASIRRNCPSAEVRLAACTYQPEPIRIRVKLDGEHSGGSGIHPDGERVVPRVTLDELMHDVHGQVLLKIDAEHAEFSIVEHAQCFDRIRAAVGEAHGWDEFKRLISRRLPDWKLTTLRDSRNALFRLVHP